MKIKEREWKLIRGKEEYAEISNDGLIHYFAGKSRRYPDDRWTWGGKSGDYLRASIGNEVKSVHQWVYLTFVGEIPKGMQVNHIDENKHNNKVENLNLMTPKQNTNWATCIARRAAAQSKAVEAIDPLTLKVVYTFPSATEAQRQGFDQGHISRCCNGQRKSHGGFIWRYKENAQEQ